MSRRWAIGLALLAAVAVAGGCSYFLGDLGELAPSPIGVSVKQPPEVLACRAGFVEAGRRDLYETRCGSVWDSFWHMWRWRCWSVWVGADIWGDVVLTLDVNDPSDDLDLDKSPQVRVGGALPGGGGCGISVAPVSIPIAPGDVVGAGAAKTVTVRMPNLTVRVTSQCQGLSATLPVSLVFRDCSDTMTSVNTIQTALTIKR